jgi:predicted nucleic acid-binding Zn ribbon protein
MSSSEPSRFAQVMQAWLSAEGLSELRLLAKVREQWQGLVGDEVALNIEPLRLQETVLVVAVTDSAWATELKFLESRIRRGLNAQLGDGAVTRIEARVKPPDS